MGPGALVEDGPRGERPVRGHLPPRALRDAGGLEAADLELLFVAGLPDEDARFGVLFEALAPAGSDPQAERRARRRRGSGVPAGAPAPAPARGCSSPTIPRARAASGRCKRQRRPGTRCAWATSTPSPPTGRATRRPNGCRPHARSCSTPASSARSPPSRSCSTTASRAPAPSAEHVAGSSSGRSSSVAHGEAAAGRSSARSPASSGAGCSRSPTPRRPVRSPALWRRRWTRCRWCASSRVPARSPRSPRWPPTWARSRSPPAAAVASRGRASRARW